MKDKNFLPVIFLYALLLVALFISCSKRSRISEKKQKNGNHEIISLLGKKLYAPDPGQTAMNNYEKAKKAFMRNPNEENTIWYGRRTAYLYRYNEAIKIYTEGLKKFPESYRLYRHRGHRFISIKKFDRAVTDLKKAADLAKEAPLEIEPDGIPNKLNTPLSNTHFNIWYHLGLAYYLKGDFEKAASAYRECMKWSRNDDLITATVDWLYMTYRRLGKDKEAEKLLSLIKEKMKIIENQSYYLRLMMYKGLKTPESLLNPEAESEYEMNLSLATQGYGVGNWYLYNGHEEKARKMFHRVVEGKSWSAFGYIAAEVDLLNSGNKTSQE